MENQIEFTRINKDVNGNPRYVCHFLNFVTEKDEEQIKEDFAASLARGSLSITGLKYELALKRAKKIGGKKFNNKQYGGGIVFQSYSIPDTIKSIQNLLKNLEK